MVKRKRSYPSSNIEEKPADGSQLVEMSREAVAVAPAIGCGTRSRPQSNPTCSSAQLNLITNANNTNVKQSDPVEAPNPTEGSVKTAPRTSARVSKRVNREAATAAAQTAVPKKAAKQTAEKCSPDRLKTRRSWELWSAQDTDAFYEALCEYGKDFENIQLYIAQRNKRKSGPVGLTNKHTSSSSCVMTKNKDQVRHFYYRTWNKISKYLEFPDEVKKQTQELYGLINFGEMRKKMGIVCLSEKHQGRLNELVMHGSTSIKYKGKKYRLKTPICRALKKLNNIEDCKEPETSPLPKEVCVELRPASNCAFAHVQSLAQNPNLRTRVAYSKRLSTLLTYLEKRWKPLRLKHRDQVLSALGKSCEDTASTADHVVRLRVVGHCSRNNSTSSTLSVLPVESLSWSCDLSLQRHLARIQNRDDGEKRKNKKHTSSGVSVNIPSVSEVKSSNGAEEAKETGKDDLKVVIQDEESTDAATQAQRSLSLLKTMLSDMEPNDTPDNICSTTATTTTSSSVTSSTTDSKMENTEVCSTSSTPVLCQRVPSKLDAYLKSESSRASVGEEEDGEAGVTTHKPRLTLGQLLGSMANQDSNINKALESEPLEEEMDSERREDQPPSELTNGTDLDHSPVAGTDLRNQSDLEQLRTKGWTLATCQSLTFGELCLMLDLPDKVILEYDWEVPENPVTNVDGDKAADSSTKLSTDKVTTEKTAVGTGWLSQVLGRLLSVSMADFKGKQGTSISPIHRSQRGNQCSSSNAVMVTGNNNVGQVIGGQPVNSAVMTPPTSKPGRRMAIRIQRQNCLTNNNINKTNLVNGFLDGTAASQKQPQIDELDQHVFVVPISAAPRKTVTSSVESVKDHLDRLVPGNRRLQRGMRHKKPLVVQRPLLPRQGQGSSPGSMTVLQLVPSSSRTLVLPAATTTTVQISATGTCNASPSSLGFVTPGPSATGLVASEVPVVVATPTSSTVSPARTTLVTTESDGLVRLAPDSTPTATTLVTAETLQAPLEHLSRLGMLERPGASGSLHDSSPPVHISIPEPPDSAHLPSILDITLQPNSFPTSGLSDVSRSAPTSTLLDFGDNSNSSLTSAFGLSSVSGQHVLPDPLVSARQILVTSVQTSSVVSSTTVTPPHSPNSRFKVSSPGPESQWLNGEGGEFSLSSLLGTLDSPLKHPSHQAVTTNNNSMDSASCMEARLGREVDNQLHCLINENSVDYVAKFADLAAQISSTENKCG